MFKTGDHVVYGTNGVCEISDIQTRKVGDRETDYYVLRPVYNGNTTLYVPASNEKLVAKMKETLTKEEVIALIRSIPSKECVWIENESERKEAYRSIVASGDRTELIRLIKTLHLHRAKQLEVGKKLHISDEKLLTEAEKILHDEFAYVLDIDRECIVKYILEEKDKGAV